MLDSIFRKMNLYIFICHIEDAFFPNNMVYLLVEFDTDSLIHSIIRSS